MPSLDHGKCDQYASAVADLVLKSTEIARSQHISLSAFDCEHVLSASESTMLLMRETANVYDGLMVDKASLVKTDRFHLDFSDGTEVELTLRQIQAIRLIQLTGTPSINSDSFITPAGDA